MRRRPRLLRALSALLLALLAGSLSRQASAAASARDTIEQTSARVLEILRTANLPVEEKRRRIEQIAYDTFDFDTMSKLVLARGWRDLSPDQQHEFVGQFRTQLALTYGRRIDHYGHEELKITGERTEPRGDVTVQSRVMGGQYDNTAIDYRLRQAGDSWKIIDVIVEGVSLVGSYRSQFQELLDRGGPQKVLALLREKNAAGASVDVAEPPPKTN